METVKYITVLDYMDGEVYQYEIAAGSLAGKWCPDHESCEQFLIGKGHNLNNCEWMIHKSNTIHHG